MGEKRKYLLGYRKDDEDRRDYPIRMFLPRNPADIPPRVIWEHPSPIKDQGHTGMCVGFACAALKEWQEVKQHTLLSAYKDVSEMWIYWKAKQIDPWGEFAEGTSFRYALRVLQQDGVPPESAWPFMPYNSQSARGKPKIWAAAAAKLGRIKSYARIDTMPQMKETLAIVGPVLIGIECFNGIFNLGADGVVPLPSAGERPQGGHAMLAVGYDDSRSALRLRNSWGKEWGDHGLCWLPYAYFDHGYVLDAWTTVDL